jgi:hypothetical protein
MGYAHNWTDLTGNGNIDVNSGKGGVYAAFSQGGFYLNGYAGEATILTMLGGPAWEEMPSGARAAKSLMGTLVAGTNLVGVGSPSGQSHPCRALTWTLVGTMRATPLRRSE